MPEHVPTRFARAFGSRVSRRAALGRFAAAGASPSRPPTMAHRVPVHCPARLYPLLGKVKGGFS